MMNRSSTEEERLLRLLVRKFRRSKKDTGENRTLRRTSVDPSELYPSYHLSTADYDRIEALHTAAEELENRGLVQIERIPHGTEIRRIHLVDDRVTDCEQLLSERYGIASRDDKLSQAEALVTRYEKTSPACARICARVKEQIDHRRVPSDLDELKDVLRALAFIEENDRPLYIRELSMLVFGSSKYFEEHVLHPVCRALRQSKEDASREESMPDEILRDYGILREADTLKLKGPVCLELADKSSVSVDGLPGGISCSTELVQLISRVHVSGNVLLTVENKTAFDRLSLKDAVTVYLGGYANRYQRDFLKLVHRDHPELIWRHFGDIDAGGFFILADLCRKTGIPFVPWHMGRAELSDDRFASCLQPLQPVDRRRLKSLSSSPFRETVEYMLEHDVKLEQEIIALTLLS